MTDIYVFASPGRKLRARELFGGKARASAFPLFQLPSQVGFFEVSLFQFAGQVESRETLRAITFTLWVGVAG